MKAHLIQFHEFVVEGPRSKVVWKERSPAGECLGVRVTHEAHCAESQRRKASEAFPHLQSAGTEFVSWQPAWRDACDTQAKVPRAQPCRQILE